jgi:hypothetical protein
MPWQLWLIFGLPLALILLVLFLLRGVSRSRPEDAGLRILEPTRRWDEWVNEALAVADDRPPPSRRLR